jgi:MinD-like ATPase involved in chromosome partitioning or flagellar assembly
VDTRTIILADNAQDTKDIFRSVFESPDYNLQVAVSTADALSRIFADIPDIVVLGADFNENKSVEIIRTIRANSATSQIPALVILPENQPDLRKLYSSAGECEFMIKPLTPGKVKKEVDSQIKGKNLFGYKLTTKIITFSGARGGAGTTSVAANTAVSMLEKGNSVILLETSSYFSGIKPVLNVSSKHTVPSIMSADERSITREMIEEAIITLESGLKTIPTIASIADMEKINAQAIQFMRYNLCPAADYAVFDAGFGMNEAALELFDISDQVIFVATLDISSLYNLELISQVFEGTRINVDKCAVVFNHVHSSGEIPEALVRNTKLKMPVIGFIPNHPAGFVKALNEGKPYVSMFPRTPSSKVIKSISDRIFSATADEEKESTVAA